MRYELGVGETGARSGTPHSSAHHLYAPRTAGRPAAPNHHSSASRRSSRGLILGKFSPSVCGRPCVSSWIARNDSRHDPAGWTEVPSPITTHYLQITAFLIDTLPIRNTSNSFPVNKCAHSNRHSSEALSTTQFGAPRPDFASRTTPPELPYLLANLLCYSFLVTRVPPNGLRASAPARSHGCGVDVSLPRNVRTTGAFPHKFDYSTGLMGLASLLLRDGPRSPFGFRSAESPVGGAGVKETTCAS
jgi:hypothetical protein